MPSTPTAAVQRIFDQALQDHKAGRLADAEARYHQVIALQPDHAGAHHLLGLIAHQVGRHDRAVDWIRQAIVLNPKDPAAHLHLGEAYRALGRVEEAAGFYRRAIELDPDNALLQYFAMSASDIGVPSEGLTQPLNSLHSFSKTEESAST